MQSSSLARNQPTQIKVLNLSPCELNIAHADSTLIDLEKPSYLNNDIFKLEISKIEEMFKNDNTATFVVTPSKCVDVNNNPFTIPTSSLQVTNSSLPKSLIFYHDTLNDRINYYEYAYSIKDQAIGVSEMKFASFNVANTNLKPVLTISSLDYDNFTIQALANPLVNVDYLETDYGNFKFNVYDGQTIVLASEFATEICGRYTVLLFTNPFNNTLDYVLLTDIYQNGVHLGFQLVQIFVMSCAEVMYSISGISFAYSQAPPTMKSGILNILLNIVVFNLI